MWIVIKREVQLRTMYIHLILEYVKSGHFLAQIALVLFYVFT